jgi:hypothetical protein
MHPRPGRPSSDAHEERTSGRRRGGRGGQALEAGLQARSAALRRLGGPGVTLNASDQVWADPALRTERTYPKVTFDRPYLMVVTDRATGDPLFMARVADPSGT